MFSSFGFLVYTTVSQRLEKNIVKTALIGYTGFVGGNLARQTHFDDLYNSKNSGDMCHQAYDCLVCAGAPAAKWRANQEPAEDWRTINALIDNLRTVAAREFILISTVDVYPHPQRVDEKTPIKESEQQPYGKHRLLLEKFVADHFPKHTIIRLPALFGPGLKKNFIFDLIHNQLLDRTHPDSEFQFYNIEHLWSDINKIIPLNLKLVNLATEPITAQKVALAAKQLVLQADAEIRPVKYNVYSRYAPILGNRQHYIYDQNTIFPELIKFITTQPS